MGKQSGSGGLELYMCVCDTLSREDILLRVCFNICEFRTR